MSPDNALKPARYYGVEFWSPTAPEPVSQWFESAADVLAFVTQRLLPDSVFLVERIQEGVDWGNLIVHISRTGRAYVRALEHRDFYASDVSGPPDDVAFIDEAGMEFQLRGRETIPAALVIETLVYWLPKQERLPSIVWEDGIPELKERKS